MRGPPVHHAHCPGKKKLNAWATLIEADFRIHLKMDLMGNLDLMGTDTWTKNYRAMMMWVSIVHYQA